MLSRLIKTITRSVLRLTKWFALSALAIFALSYATYGLALLSLHYGGEDIKVVAHHTDSMTTAQGILSATAMSDGTAHILKDGVKLGIIRGHSHPVRAVKFINAGQAVLSTDSYGHSIVTRLTAQDIKIMTARHSLLDGHSLGQRFYDRLWQPWIKPVADKARDVVAQILPINNPDRPYLTKLASFFPFEMPAYRKGHRGRMFRDCPECPEMVEISKGSFFMGSPLLEKDRGDDEGPRHLVTLTKDFAVSRFEVTFEQWDACAKDGGCKSNKFPKDEGWGRDNRPVINISHNDIQDYLRWINSKVKGSTYKLLTEAQWEYVARAGTSSTYSFGHGISTDLQTNYNGDFPYIVKKKDEYRLETKTVGSFPPNQFGLHDMSRNVSEWVSNWYGGYEKGSQIDPQGAKSGYSRVSRGFLRWVRRNAKFARSAYRIRDEPDTRINDVGFRLMRQPL